MSPRRVCALLALGISVTGLTPAAAHADTTPATLAWATVDPSEVSPGDSVTMEAEIMDPFGVANAYAVLTSDGTSTYPTPLTLASGSATSGLWSVSGQIGETVAAGTYALEVYVVDSAGTSTGPLDFPDATLVVDDGSTAPSPPPDTGGGSQPTKPKASMPRPVVKAVSLPIDDGSLGNTRSIGVVLFSQHVGRAKCENGYQATPLVVAVRAKSSQRWTSARVADQCKGWPKRRYRGANFALEARSGLLEENRKILTFVPHTKGTGTSKFDLVIRDSKGQRVTGGTVTVTTTHHPAFRVYAWVNGKENDDYWNYCVNDGMPVYMQNGDAYCISAAWTSRKVRYVSDHN